MKLNANPIILTLDWLWRLIVKGDKDRCEVCGSKECPECHHIVSRGDYWLRWEPDNGVLACRPCHARPGKILQWLEEKFPERYAWLMKKKNELHHGQKIDLEAVEERLRLLI